MVVFEGLSTSTVSINIDGTGISPPAPEDEWVHMRQVWPAHSPTSAYLHTTVLPMMLEVGLDDMLNNCLQNRKLDPIKVLAAWLKANNPRYTASGFSVVSQAFADRQELVLAER